MDQVSRYFIQKSNASAVSKDDSYETLFPEEDFPMDDFDRALLAETFNNKVEEERYQYTGATLPVKPITTECGQQSQDLRNDLQYVHRTQTQSCIPITPVPNPTASALEKKRLSYRNCVDGFARSKQRLNSNTCTSRNMPNTSGSNQLPTVQHLSHAPPMIRGIQLVETTCLPDYLRSIFKFPLFNAIQSKCYVHAYEGNDNLVLSAPTGSGKTAVMELAICRLLHNMKGNDFKVVYQAPTKTLCSERYRDWHAKFASLDVQCAELTGDVEFSHLKNAQRANIIIATPEKWDSVTRKWKDNAKLVNMIKLFLVDEVHMLKESRGATLEAIVSRMKSVGKNVRFVVLSATVPNSEDVATWLGLNPQSQHLPALREVFGEDYRATELEKHVIGFQGPSNNFAFDSMLVKEVPNIIARYSKRKPVMIFCPTRNSTVKMANTLSDLWLASSCQSRLWNHPRSEVRVMDTELQKTVKSAVAFHHSGLDAGDRSEVEKGFLNGDVNVICSTSTLAMGVNLPCYLVILKGTTCYGDEGMQEYSILEVMQMLGRAGRPQFEASACAVIMTNKEKVARYETMIAGQDRLESCLHQNLTEHLNSEIGIGTVHDITSAKRWLKSTFLAVRIRSNPKYYQLKGNVDSENEEDLLQNICLSTVEKLKEAGLVDKSNVYSCTDYGHAMARYYVPFDTMKVLVALPPRASVSEILNALTQAAEFKDLRWRLGERALYKKINKGNDIRFPVKVDISSPAHKASIALQAALGGLSLDKDIEGKYVQTFSQDTTIVLSHCNRLIRCVVDIQLNREDSRSAKNALELCRSICAGVWDNTPLQLKQIGGVNIATARKLAASGITSVDALSNAEPSRIELIMGRNPPYGKNLSSKAHVFPSLRINTKETRKPRRMDNGVKIHLGCDIGFLNKNPPVYFNGKLIYVCFLCETSDGKLIDFQRFSANRLPKDDSVHLETTLRKPTECLRCHLMCEEIAGTHCYAELRLNIPPMWFATDSSASSLVKHGANPVNIDGIDGYEDFDDAELADEDLLTIGSGAGSIQDVVEDIDDVLTHQTDKPRYLTGSKRKTRKASETKDQGDKWRPPLKLPNGNWTCQHSCVEDNRACKHQCCENGVKRPKRQPNPIDTDKALHRIGAISNKKAKVTHPAGVRLNNDKASKSIDDILKNVRQSPALDSIRSEPDCQLFSDTSSYTAGLSSETAHFKADALHRPTSTFSDDLPDAKFLVGATRRERSPGGHEIDSSYDSDDFVELYDRADCDWDASTWYVPQSLKPSISQSNEALLANNERKTPPQTMHNTFCTNKLSKHATEHHGIAEIPLLSASDNGTFDRFSGQNTTREESSYKNDHTYGVADFNTNSADMNDSTENAKSVRPHNEPSNLHLEPGTVSMNMDNSLVSYGFKQTDELTGASHVADVEEGNPKKLSREEEQKKLWAGLDPWMYEQFGHCIDIV